MSAADDADAVDRSLRQLGMAAERVEPYAHPLPSELGLAGHGSVEASAEAVPKKRAKASSDVGDGEEKKPKKTRQTQSCDACRARKVKCDRPPPGSGAGDDVPTKDVCTHCRQLGMACTFDYKPKKRGPPNMYLKRIQAQKENPDGQNGRDEDLGGPGPGTLAHQQQVHDSIAAQSAADIAPLRRRSHGIDAVDDWTPALARTLALHKQQAEQQKRGETAGAGNGGLVPSFMHQGRAAESQTRPYEALSPHNTTMQARPYDTLSPLNTAAHGNPLEAVIPRDILLQIIEVYFDYVYCLIPCLHKPSFMRDIHAHREERPGEEEWIALVFAVVEATLVQMPRSFVRLPKRDIKELFGRANLMVKQFLERDFTQLTVSRLIIAYFHGVAHHHLGNIFAHDVIAGANYLLSIRFRLNEESSYRNLSPIEREQRKRLFWLLYGADKTIAAIDGSPMLWHETDCGDVTLPSPLDDEFVTEEGYLDQPEGHTPVLAGFYYISKLFRLLGQTLDKRRADKQKPPAGLMLQMRINEVDQIFHQVMTLMDNSPAALKLDITAGTPGSRMDLIDEHWDEHLGADIRQMLLDPSKANRAVVKDGFLVQQANIYVTQQMVRYLVMQYREELGVLLDKELAQTGLDDDPPGVAPRRMSTRRPVFSEEEKDQIASDLLMILSKIPLEVIAVNTIALVVKVRYVASTLLDALQTPSASTESPLRASERMQRAQTYLWDFLRILSDIESLYVLEDEA